MYEKIKNITSLIRNKLQIAPEQTPNIGIVLGSGLGGLAAHIQNQTTLPYSQIPDFPQSTVPGHQGQFICGTLVGTPIIAMQGRVHYYEGYAMEQVTLPIRIMAELGVQILILSNAAGGLNMDFTAGNLMLITDHINMMPNPLVGPNEPKLGTRFPSMHQAYNPRLREIAMSVAAKNSILLHQGVYLGLTGPSYETPAEYKFFRMIGGDAVGMSTVPEVIVARHQNMKVMALSLISNVVGADAQIATNHEEVQTVGNAATREMTTLVCGIIKQLANEQLD